VPLGIVSGLLTPRVVAYLERRKLLKTYRTKAQDLIAYQRIEDFRSGKRDRYPSYILLAVGAVINFVAFVALLFLIDLKYAGFIEGTVYTDSSDAHSVCNSVRVLSLFIDMHRCRCDNCTSDRTLRSVSR
jgi:hypothetical protein